MKVHKYSSGLMTGGMEYGFQFYEEDSPNKVLFKLVIGHIADGVGLAEAIGVIGRREEAHQWAVDAILAAQEKRPS
jgi:hypothetical protein